MKGSSPDTQDDQSSSWDISKLTTEFVNTPFYTQVGLWLLFILAAKFNTILEPPVWDSAMGVFPPAIELYRSNWDIYGLLQQGNWTEGGANIHSLSLYTWFLAAVMVLTDSATTTFAVVHLTTFLLIATALARLSETLRARGVGNKLAIAAPALILCLPLTAVQIGYLYTESWVMAFGVFAWAAWAKDSLVRSVLWASLAISIKLTGLAIAACIASALIFRILGGDRSRRVLLLLPVLPATLVVVFNLGRWLDAAPIQKPVWGEASHLARLLFGRLATIPDITLLWAAGIASGGILFVIMLRRSESLKELLSVDSARWSDLICAAMPAVFACAIAATQFDGVLFLPRYITPAIPFAVAAIALLAMSINRESVATMVFISLAFFGVLNWHGQLYSEDKTTFSIVERSHDYQAYHAVQRELITALVETPPTLPIFVSREIDYMTSDAMMGYTGELTNRTEPLYTKKWAQSPLDAFPDEFLIAYSNPGHGGEVAKRLLETAGLRKNFSIQMRVFERQGFRTTVFWIRRDKATEDTQAKS